MCHVTVEKLTKRASGGMTKASVPTVCRGRVCGAGGLAVNSGWSYRREGSHFEDHLASLEGTVKEMPFSNGVAISSAEPPGGTFSWFCGRGAPHECTTFTELPAR